MTTEKKSLAFEITRTIGRRIASARSSACDVPEPEEGPATPPRTAPDDARAARTTSSHPPPPVEVVEPDAVAAHYRALCDEARAARLAVGHCDVGETGCEVGDANDPPPTGVAPSEWHAIGGVDVCWCNCEGCRRARRCWLQAQRHVIGSRFSRPLGTAVSAALAELRAASIAGPVTVETAVAALRSLCAQHREKLPADELAEVEKVCAMAPACPPARGFQILTAVAGVFASAPDELRSALAEYQDLVAEAAVAAGGIR